MRNKLECELCSGWWLWVGGMEQMASWGDNFITQCQENAHPACCRLRSIFSFLAGKSCLVVNDFVLPAVAWGQYFHFLSAKSCLVWININNAKKQKRTLCLFGFVPQNLTAKLNWLSYFQTTKLYCHSYDCPHSHSSKDDDIWCLRPFSPSSWTFSGRVGW